MDGGKSVTLVPYFREDQNYVQIEQFTTRPIYLRVILPEVVSDKSCGSNQICLRCFFSVLSRPTKGKIWCANFLHCRCVSTSRTQCWSGSIISATFWFTTKGTLHELLYFTSERQGNGCEQEKFCWLFIRSKWRWRWWLMLLLFSDGDVLRCFTSKRIF